MILSAIYIENHFLFDKPQIINFGGKYFFSILENGKISKEENKSYIPNFYNEDNVLLLSAIVGKNGAGKSSLLQIISNSLNNQYGYSSAIIIYEDNDKVLVSENSNIKVDFHHEIIKLNNTVNTFYYSPFLDFKNSKSGFDLSYDTILENDLQDINLIRKSNSEILPLQQLKMKNAQRQMNFKNSKVGKEICEIFGIPSDNFNKITFTRYIIEVDRKSDEILFHNTPFVFRDFLQFIYSKIKLEAEEINKKRIGNFQKDLLKNYFLMDFICLFIIQMEKENRYLGEGFLRIDFDKFKENFKSKSSLDSFFHFLENHYYKFFEEEFTLLPISESIDLIMKVNEFIDLAKVDLKTGQKEFDWSEKAIYLEQSKAIEILELQNAFLNKVNDYYKTQIENFTDLKYAKESKIGDFINFLPSERELSSGENALLNLFSRFHESFEEMKNLKWFDYTNIVLLDEADLGFHPKWKKQFVKTILYFFDSYFKSYESRVQIIFTTHDPLTLSDVLNYNVIYLDKENVNIVYNEQSKPKNSFGANISDLLSDSFFVGDGLIGDFAKNKIQEVIEYINDEDKRVEKKWITSHEVVKKVIDQIGEPYLSEKLKDMFMDVFPEFKDEEINRLEEKLKQLRNDSNLNK